MRRATDMFDGHLPDSADPDPRFSWSEITEDLFEIYDHQEETIVVFCNQQETTEAMVDQMNALERTALEKFISRFGGQAAVVEPPQ